MFYQSSEIFFYKVYVIFFKYPYHTQHIFPHIEIFFFGSCAYLLLFQNIIIFIYQLKNDKQIVTEKPDVLKELVPINV